MITLADLNSGGRAPEVVASLRACCAADAWVDAVLDGQPYASDEALFLSSDAAVAGLDDDALDQALAAHPRIGERRPGAAADAAWSRQEQAGMSAADADVAAQMAAANIEYEARFGQVFLVCASGLPADRLLAICRNRIGNDPVTERGVVLGELAKIARIRLAKVLHPDTTEGRDS